MSKKIFIISVGFALLLSACANKHTADAVGYFEATEVTVSAEANGRIISFNISEGDSIIAGQSVGTIDSTQLYFSKLQLQKNAKAVSSNRPDVESQIAALKIQLTTQQREKKRVEKLLKSNAANAKQLDDINASISLLKSQIAAQRLLLSNSVASVDAQSSAIDIQIAALENQLQKCRMLAPISGTVLNTFMEAGEFAVVGKPVYRVADLGTMYLRAYVTSAQLVDLQLNQEVKVTAQFGDKYSREYIGQITHISAESEFTPKNIPTDDERADMVYAIKIKVKNDGFIKIGTYAEVAFK